MDKRWIFCLTSHHPQLNSAVPHQDLSSSKETEEGKEEKDRKNYMLQCGKVVMLNLLYEHTYGKPTIG